MTVERRDRKADPPGATKSEGESSTVPEGDRPEEEAKWQSRGVERESVEPEDVDGPREGPLVDCSKAAAFHLLRPGDLGAEFWVFRDFGL